MTKNNAIRLLKEAGWHGDIQKEKVVADLAGLNLSTARDYYEIGASNRQIKRNCTCEKCNHSIINNKG